MQNAYDILKCLEYIQNLLSCGNIRRKYDQKLYHWYDEIGQTIIKGVKVDEKEYRICIKDFVEVLRKKTKRLERAKPSLIEKNLLLLGDIFRLDYNEKELIGLMFRQKQYAFFSNFVESFLGYNWEQLENYAHLLGLMNVQMMKMFRKDSMFSKTNILDYDYREKIDLLPWVSGLLIGRYKSKEDMLGALIGKPLSGKLSLENFSHIKQYDKIALLLKNAVARKEKGINILLYGDVGCGKTEFAKALAKENDLKLYAVAEDGCGYNNISLGRVRKLKSILCAIEKENNVVLMFDEIEDVFYNSPFQSRPNISKVDINRLLENNSTPVIWICNKIRYLDKAYLRRFSYVVHVERPSRMINEDILAQSLKKYHIKYQTGELKTMTSKYNLTPAVFENVAKATSLMGGNADDMQLQLEAMEQVINGKGGCSKKYEDFANFNTKLLNTDLDLEVFNQRIISLGKLDFSLCLYGASGTGKTAYANYLANRMGLEVLEKRASDLIGPYVGETEQNIAMAFDEAKQNKAVLIFDEGDSFLQDRSHASRSWEITQVNEMLTQMETHPYPFICTTNLMSNIDQASLRRFTFKIKYDYMTDVQLKEAFEHFFKLKLTENLHLKLTPGDFNVVRKKAEIMGFLQDEKKLISMLEEEQLYREPKHQKIGFI